MKGDEVLEQIRKINPFVDVVIYSNFRDFYDAKKLINMGITGYINKGPEAELDELIDKVLEILSPVDSETFSALLKSTPNDLFE